MLTQACLRSLALAVGLLAGVGIARVWIIWAAAGALGFITVNALMNLRFRAL
jgi:hypothetical protein